MQNLDKEIKKAVEKLTAGDKIQMELDRKNNCLKIWKLNLKKIEVKEWVLLFIRFCNWAKSKLEKASDKKLVFFFILLDKQ